MSGKKAKNSPGLCPVKGKKSGRFSRTRARSQFSILSLSITKIALHYQIPVIHTALCVSFYILPRDPQGRLRSYKLLNRTVCASLSAISFPRTPACPVNQYSPYSVPVRVTIPRLLALSRQWRRCFGSLKCLQSRLNFRANTNIFICLTRV